MTYIAVILFGFLHDSLFGSTKQEAKPIIQKNDFVISLGDISPEEMIKIRQMKSDASVLDLSSDCYEVNIKVKNSSKVGVNPE